MPSNRLLAIITVLTCFGSAAGAQTNFPLDTLREIERFVVARDCWGLRIYLATNASLLNGPDPLSAELRKFASGVDQGIIECLSLDELDAETASIGSAYLAGEPY